MTDQQALLAAILADPAENTKRLVYADWLEVNAGESECARCNGFIAWTTDVARPYPGDDKPYQCLTCSGTGRISNGYAARAAFIRVQVELAGITGHFVGLGEIKDCPICNREEELRRRERELWGSYPDTNDMRAAFRRECPALESWVVLPASLVSGSENVSSLASVSRGFVSRITCSWTDWLQHADSIRAAQPVERVRVTTEVQFEPMISNGNGTYKHRFWPGIEFELPPAQVTLTPYRMQTAIRVPDELADIS